MRKKDINERALDDGKRNKTVKNGSGKKMKILVVSPSLDVKSGVASHIMNYYRELRDTFDIDVAIYSGVKNEYAAEILKSGGKIFYFKKSFLVNWRSLKGFFKNHAEEYDVIHCHTFNYGMPYLLFAKRYGISKRIIHIHSVKYSDNVLKSVLNHFFIRLCLRLANVYVSCSEQAGKKAFGKRPFTVINNGIEVLRFSVENNVRKKYREKLGVKDGDLLLGNVGKLSKTKNQIFAIKVFMEMRKKPELENSKFIIIGSGPQKTKLFNYVKKNNLEKNVIILSDIHNISDYYAAMDCFIFPSLCEGLGIALLEAQASGLPCFCTNGLPKEVFATSLVCGLDLKSGEKKWSERILRTDLTRRNVKEQLMKAGLDISQNGKKMQKFYRSLGGGEK